MIGQLGLSLERNVKKMRKKRTFIYLGVVILFLMVDMLLLCNIIGDVMFMPGIQETTGTIICVEEKTHDWDTGRTVEFSYTVGGTHYKGTFTYLCKEISPELSLGKQIPVSYSGNAPENARQGSVVRIIGIFVLKCSMYIFCNLIFFIGWVVRITMGTKYRLSPRVL